MARDVEKLRSKKQRHYLRHRAEILAKKRMFHVEHRTRITARKRRWYAKNRGRLGPSHRTYAAARYATFGDEIRRAARVAYWRKKKARKGDNDWQPVEEFNPSEIAAGKRVLFGEVVT